MARDGTENNRSVATPVQHVADRDRKRLAQSYLSTHGNNWFTSEHLEGVAGLGRPGQNADEWSSDNPSEFILSQQIFYSALSRMCKCSPLTFSQCISISVSPFYIGTRNFDRIVIVIETALRALEKWSSFVELISINTINDFFTTQYALEQYRIYVYSRIKNVFS